MLTLAVFPTRLLTSEDECKWFWHQMIYFPGTINTVSTRLYCHTIYITMNSLHLPAMHVNSLCACWHPEVAKGSSSLSFCHLFTSLWVTSSLFLCPRLTDAPCPSCGARPPPLSQNGAFIHRVRTPSLSRVQDKLAYNFHLPLSNGSGGCSRCNRKAGIEAISSNQHWLTSFVAFVMRKVRHWPSS